MSEEPEIKGVIPAYYSLIIDKLNRIYDAWDNNNPNLALDRTLKLIPFLPRKLKKKLKDEKIRIQNRIKTATKTSGYNLDNAREKQWTNIKQVALEEFEPLLDILTDYLDEAHLLTLNFGMPTRKGDLSTIGENLK